MSEIFLPFLLKIKNGILVFQESGPEKNLLKKSRTEPEFACASVLHGPTNVARS